jgi:hypothetical protein
MANVWNRAHNNQNAKTAQVKADWKRGRPADARTGTGLGHARHALKVDRVDATPKGKR